jgi:hypothetical protein
LADPVADANVDTVTVITAMLNVTFEFFIEGLPATMGLIRSATNSRI